MPELSDHSFRKRFSAPPVIGISAGTTDSKSFNAIVKSVKEQGGEPLLLVNHAERIQRASGLHNAVNNDLKQLDAIILMGNDEDIDPAKYGEATHPKTKVEHNASRAAYEERLVHEAIDHHIPMLGICSGMQRINVALGGSLHQHIPDMLGHERHWQKDIPGEQPTEAITLLAGTRLSELTNNPAGGTLHDNSFHHQAVNRIAPGFKTSALSADAIIEAIEPVEGGKYDGQFLMGVQWHPEFGASEFSKQLIGTVVEEGRANSKQQSIAPERFTPLPPTPKEAGFAGMIQAQRQAGAQQVGLGV